MNGPVGLGDKGDLAVLILMQFVEDYRYPSGCGSLTGKPLNGEMKRDLVGFIKEMIKLKEESAQMYKSIPLHGIGMLYEKSRMGERLEDDELEQLYTHFLLLADLLLKSGPYFRFAANAANEEFRKLEQCRRFRLNLDKTETKGSI